jgi:hypothetical protein
MILLALFFERESKGSAGLSLLLCFITAMSSTLQELAAR